MDIIHLTAENVVISNEPYISETDQSEDDIRPIDMKSQKEVREELDRLRKLGGTYPNKDNIPSPAHIIRTEYDDVKDYRAAKDKYFKVIRDKIIKLSGNLKKLHDLNTELCREAKKKDDEKAIKNGTFYNPDELEYIKLMKMKRENRAEQTNNAAKKYYANNKDKIKAVLKKKRAEEKLDGVETNEFNKHLIKMSGTIKPLCLCGKRCDVITQKDLIKHSKLTKHQLFKSVIRLIHYNRRNRKLKGVINKINQQLKDYKRVVRNKCERTGKSFTVTNKTEKETIIYYNDLVEPIDENLTHQPRKSYIEKADTSTRSYKKNLACLQWFVHPMKT
tara:strand:+ start:251 stop:1249 length:999 start_codon:yes stop_codon:yes gene_type:complete